MCLNTDNIKFKTAFSLKNPVQKHRVLHGPFISKTQNFESGVLLGPGSTLRGKTMTLNMGDINV